MRLLRSVFLKFVIFWVIMKLFSLFTLTIFAVITCNQTHATSTEQYEWAAKASKYCWLRFSIDFFDIDKVNEYALELKNACPTWPENSTSQSYYGKCNLDQLEKQNLLSKEARAWCGFCNAHGGEIHKSVLRDLDSDDEEIVNKAINYIYMRDDLCRAPKSYAKNHTKEPQTTS